jgi:uncharacterized hydrophobic protein (TIGR00341 family)
MALRLVEISLPETDQGGAEALLQGEAILGVWQQGLSDARILVRVLLPAEAVEALLDGLEKRYASTEGFRMILLPVEAALPRPKVPEEKPPAPSSAPVAEPSAQAERISREELYAEITESSRLSTVFLAMVVLSTIVAVIGLMRNNVAIEIGAMVLAPLLGPNMALSLATTLGDMELARRALKAAVAGILAAFALSVGIALVLRVDPSSSEIMARTNVGLGDVGLALASGVAGALAFTTGVSATLVGVMVAVALLPPLVSFGLLLGGGHSAAALGAMLLLVTNLICLNLAGVVTFMVQGIHPRKWWEAARARKATRFPVVTWAALLLALVGVILLSQKKQGHRFFPGHISDSPPTQSP